MITKAHAQLDRFEQAASQLDCIENEAAIDAKLKGSAGQRSATPPDQKREGS